MTDKSAFTPEEWDALMEGPMSAAMVIAVASPSLFGAMKEAMSAAKNIAKATEAPQDELMTALMAEFKNRETAKEAQPELESRKDPAQAKAALMAKVQNAAAVANQKATAEEAKSYRNWLYQIAVDAANASKEGGFLGIGAVRVSDAEKAALHELATALGVEPSEPAG